MDILVQVLYITFYIKVPADLLLSIRLCKGKNAVLSGAQEG